MTDPSETGFVDSATPGDVTNPETRVEANLDPFHETVPLPGLEHLGRAIVDRAGEPSGSPANFELLRGSGPRSPSERDETLVALADAFPPDA